ncbi:M1 family aminopeptidase [Pontibacter locisalis]|uniref:M1 family aminopeptidase n=1 Tax=Pontibacter locisalis TaxID=1719035 RepID=A0ABW5INN9_9BACT
MSFPHLKWLSVALASILFLNPFWAKAQDSYTVTVEDIAKRKVQVTAKLFPESDTLLMSPFGATHLKDGWATFIEDLKISNSEGEKIDFTKMDNGVFILANSQKNKPIHLSYNVNIRHEQSKWPFGYKEAAYINDEMLMATGNALFLTRLDVDSATVNFQLKQPYKVANAWKQTAPATYVANGAEELVWTVLAIGNFNLSEIQTGKTKILLAYSNDLSASKKTIESTIRKAVEKYEAIYGSSPSKQPSAPDKYLYVMNVDTSYVGGGAAFTNSISILLNATPAHTTKAGTTSWHHILIHEIGHLWNGRSLKTDESTDWFNEGFTDYLAYKVEHELGLMNKGEWKEIISQKQLGYSKAREKNKASLASAGKDKGSNYDIVYSGGLQFAHKLDTEIKEATNNKKGISDFMKNMFAAYASREQAVKNEEIKAIAEQTCSCDLSSLFQEVKDQN